MKTKPSARKRNSLSDQARSILRILVEEAVRPHGLLTYGELARRTGIANCALRVPMNHLSETLNEYAATRRKRIPPIQVMIVNGKTGVPGSGASRHIGEPYLKGASYEDLTLTEQKTLVSKIRVDIARYPDWQSNELELTSLL